MLGDADGNGAGGFAVLDARPSRSRAAGRTAATRRSSTTTSGTSRATTCWSRRELGAPNAYEPGFDLEDVAAGRYGSRLHFWNLAERTLEQTIDLGETGLDPARGALAARPGRRRRDSSARPCRARCGTGHRDNGSWAAEKVIAVEAVEIEGWPFPVPGLITDLVLSMDDRFLYFSNWLHGDLRQYDVSDPPNPKLTGQLWLGGVLGKPSDAGRDLSGGPQMLQLSFDGRRLYVTNSLYSTWDNQFYPEMRSWLLRIDCDPSGGMEVDRGLLRRLPRPPGRPGARPRGAPPGRRLHHGDLPVTLAHIIGLPVEESVLQLAPAAVAAVTAIAVAGRTSLGQLRRRLGRRSRP